MNEKRKLEGLKPEKVFYFFEEISKIPRGSGNTKQISRYCEQFAKDRNLFVHRDEIGNVYIRKEAHESMKGCDGVIIQGHLDMVTEKTAGSKHDFLKDGLNLYVEDGCVKALDTTLGADDGIAVAYALAILDSNEELPEIEALFTIDEETGMDGAKVFDAKMIKSKYMLNLDSEEEGIFVCGCAGGAKVKVYRGYEEEKRKGSCFEITINNLKGGHSGVLIHKERANADILMSRLLRKAKKELMIGIAEITGGNKDNAIPRECKSIVVTNDEKRFEDMVNEFEKIYKKEYEYSDKEVSVWIRKVSEGEFDVIKDDDVNKILFYLNNIPNGVMNMNPSIEGLVETSLNLGILNVSNKKFEAVSAVRSSVGTRKEYIKDKIFDMAAMAEAEVLVTGEYPQWEYKKNSYLRDVITEKYEKMFNKKPVTDVIHAGLECGYISEKRPDIDIVAFGPDIFDIHTTEERMVVKSVERCYNLILEVIKTIAENSKE